MPHITQCSNRLPNMHFRTCGHFHAIGIRLRGIVVPTSIQIPIPVASHIAVRNSSRISHTTIDVVLIRIEPLIPTIVFRKHSHHTRTPHFEMIRVAILVHRLSNRLIVLCLSAVILDLVDILDHVDYFAKLLRINRVGGAAHSLLGPLNELFAHLANIVIHNCTSLRNSLHIEERVRGDDDRESTRVSHGDPIEITAIHRDEILKRDAVKGIRCSDLAHHSRLRQYIARQRKGKLGNANCLSRYICLKICFVRSRAFAKFHTARSKPEAFCASALSHDCGKGNRLARLNRLRRQIREFNHRNIPPCSDTPKDWQRFFAICCPWATSPRCMMSIKARA
nr:MAG TPA: hypothetical protein [Caudoviricetes sp.]